MSEQSSIPPLFLIKADLLKCLRYDTKLHMVVMVEFWKVVVVVVGHPFITITP